MSVKNFKKVSIIQSNYIPWKGYFDLIAYSDEFIIYDEVQFTKNDWRNRNKIKTSKGLEWLSIPVGQSIDRKIKDVTLPTTGWQKKHCHTLKANYSRANYFKEVFEMILPLYEDDNLANLTVFNRKFIELICNYLGIKTKISYSWDYCIETTDRVGKLVELCTKAEAAEYVSGPAAKNYLDESSFQERNINVHWFDYAGYSEYPQLWGGFEHGVSILDLLFNCGKDSISYMKCKSFGES
ncbi:WbqC-like protein [Pseudomonas duriflava]|uniref:WbqC-like protein n=1 Tax=Pseudomonas duriflava TaxID=459528 RepID=A0A562QA29_9PSED|nr:WbqC family protein [Pseudomonas duriflava]TWI53573.1 WbqC-like protein [Pseudomonas duriflava]